MSLDISALPGQQGPVVLAHVISLVDWPKHVKSFFIIHPYAHWSCRNSKTFSTRTLTRGASMASELAYARPPFWLGTCGEATMQCFGGLFKKHAVDNEEMRSTEGEDVVLSASAPVGITACRSVNCAQPMQQDSIQMPIATPISGLHFQKMPGRVAHDPSGCIDSKLAAQQISVYESPYPGKQKGPAASIQVFTHGAT
ncbi:hypothetical protein ABBQ38_006664 [Trebouxia sp. C0009 RCD-2024]